MKYSFVILLMLFLTKNYSQISGSFVVKGDIDKFYPVTFIDGGWDNNVPTNLILGRSNTHNDSSWRGALMASFKYHISNYGNGANFIDTNITATSYFIGGWSDATTHGTCHCIIIWLKGGNTTYFYQSNYAINQVVYDGVQNPLPYNEVNGPVHTFKTIPDNYVGVNAALNTGNLYVMGNLGIGTTLPDEKLTVKGKIHAQEIKVDMLGALVPDYVFTNDYKLKSLHEVEDFIKQNSHLPEIPSAKEIEKNGLMLAEMNMSLLKKIEEITLYMIEMKKENEILKKNQSRLEKRIKIIENK
ncbi:tail fiber protein [Flavobacterium hydatis]|uniref:Peptidase S74 domain-containing protein n=1 Tax=Flavobacterium hydatis TaxID=991 RepID=A0ABX4CI03_FLAHY|nr:tail fiber protein [Flavobacterium hydatis]OXA94253.1 hypothetical protein B0A62_11390 [Flavobacterium hydatis]